LSPKVGDFPLWGRMFANSWDFIGGSVISSLVVEGYSVLRVYCRLGAEKGKGMVQKRFVAGAVCPRCGELDKIVVFRVNDQQQRECIRCGFSDLPPDSGLPEEPKTRVSRAKSRMLDTEVQIVHLSDGDEPDDKIH
jgi:uncharacterized metal-binding protein (TIGR02443 family)